MGSQNLQRLDWNRKARFSRVAGPTQQLRPHSNLKGSSRSEPDSLLKDPLPRVLAVMGHTMSTTSGSVEIDLFKVVWRNPRRQLLDCLAHGVVEVVQPLPVQFPIEGGADVGASQPKFDVIGLVDHRVLGAFRSVADKWGWGTHSDRCEDDADGAKTTLAGVMFESSFARFKASMVAFNTRIVPSPAAFSPAHPSPKMPGTLKKWLIG